MYQIFPLALGRDHSEKELHVWDPDCDLVQSEFAGCNSLQMECRWGAGLIDEEAALILYLFYRDETIEVYFPQDVAVGPGRKMNSWDTLLSMLPESLMLVYGDNAGDRSHWLKITFEESDRLMRSLEEFIQQIMDLDLNANPDPALEKLTDYFSKLTGDRQVTCP